MVVFSSSKSPEFAFAPMMLKLDAKALNPGMKKVNIDNPFKKILQYKSNQISYLTPICMQLIKYGVP